MNPLSRRLVLKALGVAPVAAPLVARNAMGAAGLAAVQALPMAAGAYPASPSTVGSPLNTAEQLLRSQAQRAQRLHSHMMQLRLGHFDHDISGMKSWAPSYKALQQFNRDEAADGWFDELRQKLGWL